MTLRLSIIGATGQVGAALAVHILRSGLLRPGDHLQLVGRDGADRRGRLLGLAIDLQDSFDDLHVPIETAVGLEAARGDIVVVAAGETISTAAPTRRDLAARNAGLFERVGVECAPRNPESVFVVVSNPVELAVALIARHAGRRRVIGMGAQQDSLRFARAVATDLGVSRHDVHATVVGEHGAAMVPLWGHVRLVAHAAARADLVAALAALRERASARPLAERVDELRTRAASLLSEDRFEEAFGLAHAALPDARIFVEPFVTTSCLHSTGQATANATLALVAALSGRRSARLNGQVVLDGDALDLHGVCGLPIHVDRLGWTLDRPDRFTAGERAEIMNATRAIAAFTDPFLRA